jgi:primary-amine oxidase
MEMHWQGFTLTPRDLTAQRVDPPAARQDVNGKPADTR